MSQRQRRARAKARRHAPRKLAGTLAATAAIGLASPPAEASADLEVSQVKDARPGLPSGAVSDPVNVAGTLYFTANDGDHRHRAVEVRRHRRRGRRWSRTSSRWRPTARPATSPTSPARSTSPPTTATAASSCGSPTAPRRERSLVEDINPGAGSLSYPHELTNVGGTLFFSGRRRHHRHRAVEVRRHRGGTTVMVKDIRTGPGNGSSPDDLTSVGGTLFFSADDGTDGHELWKSDGTAAGTVLVKDIQPGPRQRQQSRTSSPTSAARCSSPPTTAPTATSSGSPTAPRRPRYMVKDIQPGRGLQQQLSRRAHRRRRHALLQRRRRHRRRRAVEVRRHRGDHGHGQGHRARGRPRRSRVPHRRSPARSSSAPTTAPRPRAVEVRRHRGDYGHGREHRPGSRQRQLSQRAHPGRRHAVSSAPPTGPPASSCGSRTATRRARFGSRTSIRGRRTASPRPSPTSPVRCSSRPTTAPPAPSCGRQPSLGRSRSTTSRLPRATRVRPT